MRSSRSPTLAGIHERDQGVPDLEFQRVDLEEFLDRGRLGALEVAAAAACLTSAASTAILRVRIMPNAISPRMPPVARSGIVGRGVIVSSPRNDAVINRPLGWLMIWSVSSSPSSALHPTG